jgi:Flp pilus assembly protein TadG
MMAAIKKCLRDIRGAVAVEFALILPTLILMTIGALEIGFVVFEYHEAREATRRGARIALIEGPLTDISDLSSEVTCNSASCDATAFGRIATAMQSVMPRIDADMITVSYRDSGVNIDPDGVYQTPLVTVSVGGLRHEFMVLKLVPGLTAGFDYPDFATSRLSHSVDSTS